MLEIKQAGIEDISLIEEILTDVVDWLERNGHKQWSREWILWEKLSENFSHNDFYIAYLDEEAVSCMAVIDHDPAFWPDIPKGESLYIHKLAVKRCAAGQGIARAMLDFVKEKCRQENISSLRLDCSINREKLVELYTQEGFVAVENKLMFKDYHALLLVYNIKQ